MVFNFNKKTIFVGVADLVPTTPLFYISISYNFQKSTANRFATKL